MFLEFWRHGSNAALACGVLIICACAALGFAPLSALWILAGVLVFHSSEYTFHRFLFHAPPSKRGWLLRLQKGGTDPIDARRAQRLAQAVTASKAVTFQACAEQYIASHRAAWKHPKHVKQWEQSLAAYAYPVIGAMPVAAIDTGLVMRCIEPHWATKTETVSRLRGWIELVLDWARVRGYRQGENPARWRGHLDKLLPAKGKVARASHHAAVAYQHMPAFMVNLREVDSASARALEFIVLTACRVNEALGSAGPEFDLKVQTWTIPAERMKGGREHRVPLSERAITIVSELIGSGRDHIFAGVTSETVRGVLRRLVKNATIHGFRSSFKDWCAESTSFPDWVSEKALAHLVGDETQRAYQRGDLLAKRRELMAAWASYCESVPGAANVVQLRRAEA
jgi:integrase